ncbi:hypothetical protein [Streptomyces silvensis]|uniref:Uncharacterized protein n=1 Tax=Streptomyces silvensis TaxID=1765722 RepID=A0A0W7X6T0_9ACTN|nr:hypothetical protein [Streptomyces silvensis]KUF18434.1 hypothetical protein AT728_18985 [Streptomyces silvensis]
MIEAFEVLFRAFIWWIIAAAVVLTIALYALAAIVACAWQALRRRHTGPSWARGPLHARNLARRLTRPAHGHTAKIARESS